MSGYAGVDLPTAAILRKPAAQEESEGARSVFHCEYAQEKGLRIWRKCSGSASFWLDIPMNQKVWGLIYSFTKSPIYQILARTTSSSPQQEQNSRSRRH